MNVKRLGFKSLVVVVRIDQSREALATDPGRAGSRGRGSPFSQQAGIVVLSVVRKLAPFRFHTLSASSSTSPS